MKKSLKLLSAAFVAIMLLSAVATPVAMAASSTTTTGSLSALDLYILEQLPNAIPLSNGSYMIPNVGVVTAEKIQDLYSRYWGTLYPSYKPG